MPLPSLRHDVCYAEDLRDLLRWGTLVKQKVFLRAFIKRKGVNHHHIALDSPHPSHTSKGRTSRASGSTFCHTRLPGPDSNQRPIG